MGIVAREQLDTLLEQAQTARRAKRARPNSAAPSSPALRIARRSRRRETPHARRAVTDSVR